MKAPTLDSPERYVLMPIDLYSTTASGQRLTSWSRDVYCAARSHDMTDSGIGGGAFPSIRTLSEMTGQSPNRVRKSLEELVDFGALEVRRRYVGDGRWSKTNRYLFPDIEARKQGGGATLDKLLRCSPHAPEVGNTPTSSSSSRDRSDISISPHPTSVLRTEEKASTTASTEKVAKDSHRSRQKTGPTPSRRRRPVIGPRKGVRPGIGIKAAYEACKAAWGGRIVSPEECNRQAATGKLEPTHAEPVRSLDLTDEERARLREEIEEYVRQGGAGPLPQSGPPPVEDPEVAALRAELETYLLPR